MGANQDHKPKRGRTFLREWRKFRDLTQQEAVDRLGEEGVDRTTLGRIERGVLPYNQDFLERMALLYGCDPGDLLTINPLLPDQPRLVYDHLRNASPELRERALMVLDALLKAG